MFVFSICFFFRKNTKNTKNTKKNKNKSVEENLCLLDPVTQ